MHSYEDRIRAIELYTSRRSTRASAGTTRSGSRSLLALSQPRCSFGAAGTVPLRSGGTVAENAMSATAAHVSGTTAGQQPFNSLGAMSPAVASPADPVATQNRQDRKEAFLANDAFPLRLSFFPSRLGAFVDDLRSSENEDGERNSVP